MWPKGGAVGYMQYGALVKQAQDTYKTRKDPWVNFGIDWRGHVLLPGLVRVTAQVEISIVEYVSNLEEQTKIIVRLVRMGSIMQHRMSALAGTLELEYMSNTAGIQSIRRIHIHGP